MKLSYGTNRIIVPFPLTNLFDNYTLFDFAQTYMKRQLWFDAGNGIDIIVEDENQLWFCCKLLEKHMNANMDDEEWQEICDSRECMAHTTRCEAVLDNIDTSEEENSAEDDAY